MKRPLNIIFLGLSGSGKGTQVELLLRVLHFQYGQETKVISTGDLFRDLQEQDTDTAYRIKKILEKGGLPFDDLATMLWMHKIAYTVKKQEGIIFDGSPRRVNEAKNIDNFFTFLCRIDNTKVVYLEVTSEEVTQRLLKRGRADDNKIAIAGRIAYFQESVVPTIEYYNEQKRLIKINGEQTIEDVHKDIVMALEL
jgi:adenylate kinase